MTLGKRQRNDDMHSQPKTLPIQRIGNRSTTIRGYHRKYYAGSFQKRCCRGSMDVMGLTAYVAKQTQHTTAGVAFPNLAGSASFQIASCLVQS